MREQQVEGRKGGQRWLTGAAAVLVLGSVTACAATPANAARLWTPSYAFGTLGYRDFDVRTYCGDRGARRLRVTGTPGTLAVSVLTLGVYTPREVTIECR
jgi:hypothetical protein